MIYPARRAVFLAALGVPVALVAGVLAPRLWLSGLAFLIFVFLLIFLDIAAASRRAALRLSPSLPNGIAIGEAAHASIELSFGRGAPRTAEFAISTGTLLSAVPARQAVSVRDRIARVDFALQTHRRGEGVIDRCWIRWQGPLGLVWLQKQAVLCRKIPIVPNVQAVKEQAMRLFRRDAPFGTHIQLDTGEGAEFHALREFLTGMDRRMIDWKQSARHGRLLAREFQFEQNQHIVIALDTGRLMSEPIRGEPRIDRAVQASLLLAYVGLKIGDRVGLFAFDERPRLASGTVSGPQAFLLLQRLAARLDYSTAETNFTLGLTELSSKLARRSIVIVFTDFVDTTSAELMLENIGRLIDRHVVIFVVFRDEELETMSAAEPRTPEDVSRAVIAESLMRERDVVVERLRRLGVYIVDVPFEQIATGLVSVYLAVKRLSRV
jgi:uncharacterized protein (DUF58 family)